ncbi:hypothetical protein EP331_08740 [bacterium]|nr:MAG: hypothetical protein EP331_08740 [bacterium]
MPEIKHINTLILAISVVFLTTTASFAQMFSVKTNPKEELSSESTISFVAGSKFVDFTFDGNLLDTPSPAYVFNEPLYYLEATFGNIALELDMGRKMGNDNDLQFIRFGLQFLSEYQLVRSKWLHVTLPLIISTDSFTITSEKTLSDISNRYEQTGFSFGTGLTTTLIVFNENKIELSQKAHYGYASRGFGGKSGSRTFYNSSFNYISPRVFNQTRLVLSAGYNHQQFDLDGSTYDYTLKGLQFGLGIAF